MHDIKLFISVISEKKKKNRIAQKKTKLFPQGSKIYNLYSTKKFFETHENYPKALKPISNSSSSTPDVIKDNFLPSLSDQSSYCYLGNTTHPHHIREIF